MKIMFAIVATALSCATVLAGTRPDFHAPISVMGDHLHESGELMFSYRFMRMSMQDNRDGSSRLSPEAIVTTVPNRFANPPMMPPTLRVVPLEMTMDMHMLGLMYAPNNRVTLMAMANYVDKEMDHVSFAGPTGTTVLGTFTTSASGLGDTSVAALIRLGEAGRNRWHATLGVSLPTGDIEASAAVLTPMNTTPTVRLPYSMQLGSGTYDLIGGLTLAGNGDGWGWGGQWRSVLRVGENDANYTLGNEHQLQGWASYLLTPAVSLSGRLSYYDRGNIDGIDALVMAPVQTADPDRQGARRVAAGLGLNIVIPNSDHRLAIDVAIPVSQDLSGPQLETDWQVTIGWQYAR